MICRSPYACFVPEFTPSSGTDKLTVHWENWDLTCITQLGRRRRYTLRVRSIDRTRRTAQPDTGENNVSRSIRKSSKHFEYLLVPQLRYGYGRALITTNIFRYISYYALWKVPVREPDRSALFSIPSRQQRSVLRSVRNE
ncbi:Uncharacterized protein HZ326_13671 [Fusarium oxysporum f. sp. albedinis]|nr:Uncharacterized protein HZ326_13671 [Fusarium oxysporum f. sp. albedinis]